MNIMNKKPDYKNEIITLIRSSASPKQLKDELSDYHANDISEALPLMTIQERTKLYHLLDVSELSEILEHTDDLAPYLAEVNVKKAAAILGELEPGTAVEILQQMESEKKRLLVDLLDEESKKFIRLIASYDEELIGSCMSTNFVVIPSNFSVKQAMRSLVEQAAENDNISTIFAVDEHQVYYGAIHLTDLIIAREDTPLESLIATSFPYVYASEPIEGCIEKLKDYSEDSIPILSEDNQILGVITSQDIIEVVDEEMSDDYAKLGGLTAEEDLKEPVLESMKKRLPWLVILLGLGMLVSSVVGLFESVVSQLTLVICFQSLILDMSGNVGTQSLAVTIRVLMDEQLTGSQKLALVGKEMRIGMCNGLILGLLSFLLIGLYIFLFKSQTVLFAFSISACIGLALLIAMVISSMTGTVVPLFFKKVGVDPAVASGPLITTINDLIAVVSYYGLTWLLLIQVMKLAG